MFNPMATGSYTFVVRAINAAGASPPSPDSNSVVVTKSPQTLTFGAAPTVIVNGTGTVSASTTATPSAGYPITFSTASTNCAVTSVGVVTGINAGSNNCIIMATQAGDSKYNSATATQTLSIGKANQTITFGAAPTIAMSGTGTVTATSATPNSGNPVSFSTMSSACSITGNIVTGLAEGACVISAMQSGNNDYLDAPVVTQPLTIGPMACRLDIDGDGTHNPLIDGQLLIRHLLSMTGPALIAALPAFPPNAQRTSDSAITMYLNTLNLDIDGSGGAVLATTDGMIVLRAMFGLNGAAVTADLPIPLGALRPDWTTIGPYLSGTCAMPVAP